MDSSVAVLPMAVAMMAGPQIISAVMLATSGAPVRNSTAFVGGVATALAIGLTVSFVSAELLNDAATGGDGGSGSDLITGVIVVLLIVAAVIEFRGRHGAETPAWMIALHEADPRGAYKLGLLLILFMPSDVIVMLSVGQYLSQNGLGLLDGLGFALLTVLIAALPLITLKIGGERAEEALPRLREWMAANAWLISIGVYVFFIYALTG
jgi:hypothetical protein